MAIDRCNIIEMETDNFANMLFKRLSQKISADSIQAVCRKYNLKELPTEFDSPENYQILTDFFAEMHRRENNLFDALLKIAEGKQS